MIQRILRNIYIVMIMMALALPTSVFAFPNLAQSYILLDAYVQPSGSTTTRSVLIDGQLDTLSLVDSPAFYLVNFDILNVDTGDLQTSSTFGTAADGYFTWTQSGFDCGSTYRFQLYETFTDPDTLQTSTNLIQASPLTSGITPFVELEIDCTIPTSTTLQNIVTVPSNSQALFVDKVAWGDVTVTDNSASFVNGAIVPLAQVAGTPITIEVVYGTGSPGGSNSNYTQIGSSGQLALSSPYGFSFATSNLLPDTDYYFDIIEHYATAAALNETTLFAYHFITTDPIAGNNVTITPISTTAVQISGNFVDSTGSALTNFPIRIEVSEDGQQGLDAEIDVTTGGVDVFNGDGFFSATVSDLSPTTGYEASFLANDPASSNFGSGLVDPMSFSTPASALNNNQTTISVAGNSSTTLVYDGCDGQDGLVCCDGAGDCDFNALIDTVNAIIDFLILYIAFPMVAVVMAIAGIMLLTSGGNTSRRASAKKMIGKVVIGLIVALLSWVIIKLVLVTLGYQGPLLDVFGIQL